VTFPRSLRLLVAASAIGVAWLVFERPARGQAAAQSPVTVLSREGRRTLPVTMVNDRGFVFLDDLAALFQCTSRDESLGALTVACGGKTILLTPDQPLVSVGGRLVSLPAAPTRSGRRWIVPIEFIGRALALVSDQKLDFRAASRLVVVGDLRVPRVTVRVESGDPTRVVMETTPRAPSAVSQDNNSLSVKFEADALDAAIPPLQPQGLVQALRVVQPATVAIDLGPRFTGFRATTQSSSDATARLTVEVMSAQTEAQATNPAPSASAPAPAQSPPGASTAPSGSAPPPAGGGDAITIHTIAIDPGHGGTDNGVTGAAGIKEKDLALSVARRIKAAIEGRLGIRVLLTRDDDNVVAADARASLANNNRADLFISLHANGSFQRTTAGATVLYAAFDREAERSAHASLGSERLPVFGGGFREIDLVSWDLAQIRHVDQSGELARILEEQLRDHVPLAAQPIDRMPLRVLESLNMPAVLIEMGYLTNDQQETRMSGAGFQNGLAQAIYDGVVKYRDRLAGSTR
jgi:N-acetylmuramoyl-L-alanine amidase